MRCGEALDGLSKLIERGAAELKKYAYAWITILFFVVPIFGHWVFGGYAYLKRNRPAWTTSRFQRIRHRDCPRHDGNWQSEFLHLLWQVTRLAYFLMSAPAPQEKTIIGWRQRSTLLCVAGRGASEKRDQKIDERYLRGSSHAEPYAHREDPIILTPSPVG